MPGGRVVITDDGTGVAAELASLLQAADIAVASDRWPRRADRLELAVGHRFGRRPTSIARPDRGDRPRLAPGAPAWRAGRRARLGRTDRRRGEGPFPAGQGHGRRSGECRAGGRSVPDRRHRHGRSIRQQRICQPSTSSRATAASPVWSRRWRANGPRSVAASSTSLRMHHAKRSPSQLADEIFVSDGCPEVGYEGDRRIRLRSVASPLVRKRSRRSSSSRVSPS